MSEAAFLLRNWDGAQAGTCWATSCPLITPLPPFKNRVSQAARVGLAPMTKLLLQAPRQPRQQLKPLCWGWTGTVRRSQPQLEVTLFFKTDFLDLLLLFACVKECVSVEGRSQAQGASSLPCHHMGPGALRSHTCQQARDPLSHLQPIQHELFLELQRPRVWTYERSWSILTMG